MQENQRQIIYQHSETAIELEEKAIDRIRDKIAEYEKAIELLEKELEMRQRSLTQWEQFQQSIPILMEPNQPLTRDYIREYLKASVRPKLNNEIIDDLYNGKSSQERALLIKQLSVMLNKMEKKGEITIIKKEGTKGNYYEWKKTE